MCRYIICYGFILYKIDIKFNIIIIDSNNIKTFSLKSLNFNRKTFVFISYNNIMVDPCNLVKYKIATSRF